MRRGNVLRMRARGLSVATQQVRDRCDPDEYQGRCVYEVRASPLLLRMSRQFNRDSQMVDMVPRFSWVKVSAAAGRDSRIKRS